MVVLGIETSCDETAVALVDDRRRVLSQALRSQLAEHAPFGGVVPEVAARAHIDHLPALVEKAMADAGLGWPAVDAIAATAGPGLIGGVMVGCTLGKALALARGIPFVAVNHLEGHALTVRLTDAVGFPYLLLLVSGGHCQLLRVEGLGRYRRLGTTIDDAVGECFDKAAKLIGLPQPGGPAIERAAAAGDPAAVPLPRPMLGREGCDFSFSGLKTAVRLAAEKGARPEDLAASLQAAIADVIAERTGRALAGSAGMTALVAAGGVAANRAIRARLAALAEAHGLPFVAPPAALCTDNAAMIAWAGLERLQAGLVSPLDFAPRPRWPLDEAAALPGAKA
ncbi:MAG: tRNA (adenosine(37)-N6)-threonylcarbamoyltransferase complex transferase subunit TsaD [Thalassobaculales bacterium]